MTRQPNRHEWNKMKQMAAEIEMCDEYLKMYRLREMIGDYKKAKLVKMQVNKSMLIERLKIYARNYLRVPQSVLKIYFPLD